MTWAEVVRDIGVGACWVAFIWVLCGTPWPGRKSE